MESWTHRLVQTALLVWAFTDLLLFNLSLRGDTLWMVVALLVVGLACKVALAGLCIIMRLQRDSNSLQSQSTFLQMTLKAMTLSAERIVRNPHPDEHVRLLMNAVLERGLPLVDGAMVGPQLTSDNLLGEGAFCRVYQLHLGDTETPICMKVKEHVTYSKDDRIFNNDYCVLREVENLQRVSGLQGVPRVVAVSAAPEAFIMTMHGVRTLEAWIKIWEKAKPKEKDVGEVLHQLCRILVSLHELQVCHNDLKSDNVMVQVEKAKKKGSHFKVTLVGFALMCDYGAYPYEETSGRMILPHNDSGLRRRERKCSEATDMFSMGYLLRRVLPFFASARREKIKECSQRAMGACHFRPSFVEIEKVLRHAKE